MSKQQKVYKDDKILHYESDVEKIQTAPAQYISFLNNAGALHLTKEGINNGIDEAINKESPCDHITVYLDEEKNEFTCTDNGRGIPFDKMELLCTTIQSGSKFTRNGSGGSAGQNGVGLCAMNAMSKSFKMISYRYGKKCTLAFTNGKKTEELIEPLKSSDIDHGTTVSFIPSEFYLNDPCKIEPDELSNWLYKISHLLPKGLVIDATIKKEKKGKEVTKTYKNENGLYDLVMDMCQNKCVEPIHFLKDTHIIEHMKGEDTERFFGMELAFTMMPLDYMEYFPEEQYDSFCNFVNTITGGTHLEAAKTTVMNYLAKKTRDSLSENESKKLNITVKDVEENLILAVYISTDCHPQFTGQTKLEVGNRSFPEPIKVMALQGLDEYFLRNPNTLKKFINIVKTNAKARNQMEKAKKSVIKQESGALAEHKIPKLLPCNARGNAYREIFLVEGDSAMGPVESIRDDMCQAAFGLKGVPLNTYGLSIYKMLLNPEIKNMVMALGCNIGEKFDIKKLKYQKIIILTDSDIDGLRICSLLCCFFAIHMPEIVQGGYLYRALPPLYKVKSDGKIIYIRNTSEEVEITEKKMSKVYDVYCNGKKLSKEELKELLTKNSQYHNEVKVVSEKLPLHPELVEFISKYYDDKNFGKKLTSTFNEMTYDGESVDGILDFERWTVIIDELLIKQLKKVRYYIFDINHGVTDYEVVEKKTGKRTSLSLYGLFDLIKKYSPERLKRYKGLGEMKDEELWETTLDPNKRTLLRFTMEDVEKEADKFRILHGPDSQTRRKLMSEYVFNKDDLDN